MRLRSQKEFGAKITLLHAIYLGYIYSAEGTALYDIPALQEAARESAERRMRKFLRTVNFGGVNFQTAFTEGSPALKKAKSLSNLTPSPVSRF